MTTIVAFSIEISEVGPAEYPLIEVLHQTIHEERHDLARVLNGQRDALVLIAHLEGNPLGYSVSFSGADRCYGIYAAGVLAEYAAEGVREQLVQRVTAFAQSRGYQTIVDNSKLYSGSSNSRSSSA